MHIQLNKILVVIALLGFIFTSYPGKANPESDGLKVMSETVKNFVSSLKDTAKDMTPSTIIGLFIAVVVLAIVFRGLIFFIIMFGVLVMMFGSTEAEKIIKNLGEKFNSVRDAIPTPDNKNEQERSNTKSNTQNE